MYIYFFFIQSFISGHLGFQILTIQNYVAMNMRVQIALQESDFISFLLDICPEVGLLNHMVVYF